MASRSLPSLFQNVWKSNVAAFNTAVEDECRLITLPDGSVVQADPVACQKKVIEKNIAKKDNWVDRIAIPVTQAIAGAIPVIGTASSLAIKGANVIQSAGQPLSPLSVNQQTNLAGGTKPMGLFDDIWGAVGQAGQSIFGGSQNTIDWNGLLNTGVGLATQALTPRQSMVPAPAMSTSLAGAVPMAARAGAVVARGFFNRFPNLATAIQTLRNSGMNVTRSKLYGVMKRFGPEFLVTGGLLTAAAVNELAIAGPGHRRMNPANVRALRRSVRRIESFHRLCKTTDRLRGTSRRRKAHC